MCPTIAEMGVRLWHVSSWCARWRILRCWGFAAISQLKNECTGLPNGTHVPKSGFAVTKYPAKWSFGCEIVSFYASLPFRSCKTPCEMGLWLRNWEFFMLRSHFAAAKWGSLCYEMALMCQKLVSQLRNTLPNGALAAKLEFFTFWSFAAVSQLRNGGSCAAKWHSCAILGFAERGMRLRIGFAAKCRFRRGCEISQIPVFALFLLRFCSERLPFNFFAILPDFDHPKTYIPSKQTELKHWNQN